MRSAAVRLQSRRQDFRYQGKGMFDATNGQCQFCAIAEGRGTNGVDEILQESENFVAVASVGSLTPGWMLIVPKSHQLSLAGSPAMEEFEAFSSDVAERISALFAGAPVRAFEHGANREGSPVGCGVNHAHLHLLPSTQSLIPFFPNASMSLRWETSRFSDVAGRACGREYLYYCEHALDPVALGQIAVVQTPMSQFFRRAVASSIGQDAQFDYHAYPCLSNVERTIKLYGCDTNVEWSFADRHSRRAAA
jgi:diadenosine tetraphosphate (Ap4A) HIT family hydrolase